ncbi:YqzL family protein [Natranaerofaba carboxydovora]
MKGWDPGMLTADFFWRLFKLTGSVTAYLIYKELV